MKGVEKIVDKYLQELELVPADAPEEQPLADAWRNISNDVVNRSIASGKVNKARCIRGCRRNEACMQDCDIRSTAIVIRMLEGNIGRCRGDKRCVKTIATRIINVAQRGDERIRQYGRGVPFSPQALAFVTKLGFKPRQ